MNHAIEILENLLSFENLLDRDRANETEEEEVEGRFYIRQERKK